MKHYDRKFRKEFIKVLKKAGFTIKEGKNKYQIFKDKGPIYLIHSGLKSHHPLKSFLKTNYDFVL